MPRGRSTFTKRQKEQTRQQRQQEKAERRNQRKQDKPEDHMVDDLDELRKNAEAQASMFHAGSDLPAYPQSVENTKEPGE